MIVDPALVLVDFQNDFCREETPDGFVADSEVQPAVEAAADFLERYRASGRTPIFVRAHHHEHTVSDEWLRRYDRPGGMSARAGTEGAEIVSELAPEAEEPVVRKPRYSAFYGTNLDLHLSTNDVSHVLLAGVKTNVCVSSTARAAYDRDYRVTVLADCVASDELALHEATLENLDGRFGAVRESAEVELPPVTGAPTAE